MTLNEKQSGFALQAQGIHLVHAGPGTGKTETIKERYLHILSQENVTPSDIFLVTFTNNAAELMKKRIIQSLSSGSRDGKKLLSELVNAPISTFHSFCSNLLKRFGCHAPSSIGIQEIITDNFAVLESEIVELEQFERFINRFLKQHPEHVSFFVPQTAREDVFYLLRKLACKGIFPSRKGGNKSWYGFGLQYLLGDEAGFRQELLKVLTPEQEKKIISRFSRRFGESSYQDKIEFVSFLSGKKIDRAKLEETFREDRNSLFGFIHDVYWEYLEYTLKHNQLNFSFLVVFAYLLLSENHRLREDVQFDYVMIDEFQDTNEMQFKIAMLLSRSGNLGIIGDWKQGIYGFQYATVDNMLKFHERLKEYKKELNLGHERVLYGVEQMGSHIFEINYRSTSGIISFFDKTLDIPAGQNDHFLPPEERGKQVPFDDKRDSEVLCLQAQTKEDEMRMILSRISSLVNSRYNVKDRTGGSDHVRPVRFDDIAVLVRTKGFAMRLQQLAAAEYPGVPVQFEAGVELYRSAPALIILAWLRMIAGKDRERALAYILEKEGYGYHRASEILAGNGEVPQEIQDFKENLKRIPDIRELLSTILSNYSCSGEDYEGAFADFLINGLADIFEKSPLDIERLIHYMEKSIDKRSTIEAEKGEGSSSVVVQTIHAAKGLEYPVVFIADVNQRNFPFMKPDNSVYFYSGILGLRARKEFSLNNGKGFVFSKWQSDLLESALPVNYDEERRLYYVAASRASQYLYITASNPSAFFTGAVTETGGSIIWKKEGQRTVTVPRDAVTPAEVFHSERTEERIPHIIPVHQLMDFRSSAKGGRGKEFGTKIHDVAAKLVNGITPDEAAEPGLLKDIENIRHLIKGIKDKKIAEIECLYPCPEAVKGQRLLVRGIIDLLVIGKDRVDVIDFKTDISRDNEAEYVKQVSVYCQVAEEVYKGKKVRGYIYYTHDGEMKEIKRKAISEIVDPSKDDFGF